MQQRNAGVRDELPGAESAELRFALERLDCAVSGRRAHQVDFLQSVAKADIGDALISDSGLPCHLQPPQTGQMLEDFQTAISYFAAWILTQIQMLELWHASKVEQAIIRQLA